MGLYLDYNASAPMLQESVEAMIDSSKVLGNPSSIHRSGRQARSIIENSRLKNDYSRADEEKKEQNNIHELLGISEHH